MPDEDVPLNEEDVSILRAEDCVSVLFIPIPWDLSLPAERGLFMGTGARTVPTP